MDQVSLERLGDFERAVVVVAVVHCIESTTVNHEYSIQSYLLHKPQVGRYRNNIGLCKHTSTVVDSVQYSDIGCATKIIKM